MTNNKTDNKNKLIQIILMKMTMKNIQTRKKWMKIL